MDAQARAYEQNRDDNIRANRIRMEALQVENKKKALALETQRRPLNIDSILEGCGMVNATCANPKRSKTSQTGLNIGLGSLRPRTANNQTQNNENITDQTDENHDLELIDEDPEQGEVGKEVRKFTRKETLWARANEKLPLIKLQCNRLRQLIGPGSKGFPSIVTTLIRTKQFPLDFADWRDVPFEHKEKLIKDLSAIYVMEDWLRTHSLKSAANKWRAFKSDLKTKAFKTDDPKKIFTKDELIDRRDSRVEPEQWKWLVEYWLSEEGQNRRERAKQSRSKVTTPHTTGSKSFARAGADWAKELGRELSRHELFEKTHTKKSGAPIEQAIPKFTEITKALKDHPELLGRPIEKGDIFAYVFGRDPRGYVRGVGLGPTPASLGIEGHRSCTSTRVQMANRDLQKSEEENALLKDALQKLVGQMNELREVVHARHVTRQDDNAADDVSTPTQERGSNPTPTVIREATPEYSDHHFHDDMFNTLDVEVMMPLRGRFTRQPTARTHEGGKEVVLLSIDRPCDRPVAKATLQSTNPESRVGGSLLGLEYHEVVVNCVIKGDHVLPRQHGKLKKLADCIGHSIAWPHLYIVNEERAANQSQVQHRHQGGQ